MTMTITFAQLDIIKSYAAGAAVGGLIASSQRFQIGMGLTLTALWLLCWLLAWRRMRRVRTLQAQIEIVLNQARASTEEATRHMHLERASELMEHHETLLK